MCNGCCIVHAPSAVTIEANVRRGDKDISIDLALSKGWKRGEDLSWRASSWELRRMALGGLSLGNDDCRRP